MYIVYYNSLPNYGFTHVNNSVQLHLYFLGQCH